MWGRALFSSFISLGGDLRSVRLSPKSLFWQLITYIFPLNERKEQNHHIEEQFFFLTYPEFYLFCIFIICSYVPKSVSVVLLLSAAVRKDAALAQQNRFNHVEPIMRYFD